MPVCFTKVDSQTEFDHAAALCHVRYTPPEVGVYKIALTWERWTLPDSPFTVKVIDVSSIRLLDGIPDEYVRRSASAGVKPSSIWQVQLGDDCELRFDVSRAGPGRLTANIKSQSQTLPVTIDGPHNGVCNVRFKPVVEGEYTIEIHYGDVMVEPFPVWFKAVNLVALRDAEQSKIVLSGRGLREARCNQIAQFVVKLGAQPLEPPRVRLVPLGINDVDDTTGGQDVPVQVDNVDAKTFTCSYQPMVPGDHQLSIVVNGQPLRGSPFTVNVFESGNANHVVLVNDGEPRKCKTGEEYRAIVDVTRAGPGELTGFARGPSGELAICTFEDIGSQRFVFVLKAREAGRHSVNIQFNGQDIPSCPFDLRVTGPPDASKVHVYGAGIQDGQLGVVENVFMCDTRGAGSAELTVSVIGPTGPIAVDVKITSPKDRIARCAYAANVPGTYIIDVRWGDQRTPNSPFAVQRTAVGSPQSAVPPQVVTPSQTVAPTSLQNGLTNQNGAHNAMDDLPRRAQQQQQPGQNPNFVLSVRPTDAWSPNADNETSSRL